MGKNQKSSTTPKTNSSSKGENPETKKCSYSMRLTHDEHNCMKKQIDHLIHLLEKNDIRVTILVKQSLSNEDSSKKKNNKGKGKGKVFVAIASSSTWIVYLNSLHHIALDWKEFTSLEPSHVPHILMGDDAQAEVCGRNSIDKSKRFVYLHCQLLSCQSTRSQK